MKTTHDLSANCGIRSWILFCLVGCLVAVSTPPVARAQTAILSNVTGTYGGSSTGYTYGYGFTVGSQPISVTALGLWDQGDNGLAAARQVGIWNVAGQLQAGTIIQAGTASRLEGSFRYENITPVVLSAHTTYYIGFANDAAAGGESMYVMNTSYTVGSGVSFEQGRMSNFPSGFSAPDYGLSQGAQIGPNALYAAVPEPSTYAVLCGLVVLGVAVCRSRKHQSA